MEDQTQQRGKQPIQFDANRKKSAERGRIKMTQSTQDMLYDHVRSSARLLDEIWDAIDGTDCEACDGTGEVVGPTDVDLCEVCDGEGTVHTYEGSDAQEYLDEMPLEIVWEYGEPFAVVLGTGGPHIEIRGGTRHDGSGYTIHGYWSGEHSTWSGEGVTRTGEYFRSMVDEES
jgi:RecJ-like exonuclease